MNRSFLALCALSLLLQPLAAMGAPVLNPETYLSASGNYRLEVDPSDLYGRGAGRYRMSAGGKEKWRATFPFTLCDAVVTEGGAVVGYAYSNGVDGFSREHNRASEPGELRVVTITADGKLRRSDTIKRKQSGYLHEPPEPVATGIISQERDDRFVVVIEREGRGQTWHWIYQLSTGKKLEQSEVTAEPEATPEVSRTEGTAATPERRALPLLGSFSLQGLIEPGAVRDVAAFDLDQRGRVGFLRRERQGHSFVLATDTGEVLATVPLPTMPSATCDCDVSLSWIAGDRWLTTAAQADHSLGWWIDVGKQTAQAIGGDDFATAQHTARMSDGGFVVLAQQRTENAFEHSVVAFDSSGNKQWRKDLDGSPRAIAVTSKAEIAVLNAVGSTVQFFDHDGGDLRTIDLAKAWKRTPNYPTELSADIDGGLIVGDFQGGAPFVRMKADGSVRRDLRPMFDRDRAIAPQGGIRCAPDGALWVSDGQGVMRLDDDGMTTRVLGRKPNDSELEKISAAVGDNRGHVYAVDERTGAVHVFDEAGRRLHICKPARGDFKGSVISPHLTASDDGDVYIESEAAKPEHLHFAPDGRRVGIERLGLDRTQEWRYPLHHAGKMLVLGYQAAYLVDGAGKKIRTIERRPNGNWLDWVMAAAVASDGSFAILTSSTVEFSSEQSVNLYTAEGEPIRTLSLGETSIVLSGFDGTRVVLRKQGETIIRNCRNDRAQSFAVAEAEDGWDQFLTRDGRELWVTDFASGKVERHQMPEND